MTHPLTFGLDVGVYGALATRHHILALAALAEQSDFTTIWVADHVIFPAQFTSRYPYNATGQFPVNMTQEPLMEPVATMAVLVGKTQHVRIGASVLVMPYRNPVLLGRMLVTLDQLSGGRMILGAGVGWLAEEFSALNARDYAARGAVTDECLEIIRRLCVGGEVSFQGTHYQLAPVISSPGSLQRPHIPILIGGTTRHALNRTARFGNGWISTDMRPDRLQQRLATLRTLCEQYGKDFDKLTLTHKVFIHIGQSRRDSSGERAIGTGSVTEITDDLQRLADIGYHHIIIRFRDGDAEQQDTQLRIFIDDIMPRF
ncbi:MAG: TIGR03619 family F420-dependent LLM class oxidoreductase [Acetobacteraceae bacterium]|nr:TIGR03619 family F420-dependent LLM class oxidoreductase [Acetobacteraceae bacterium]